MNEFSFSDSSIPGVLPQSTSGPGSNSIVASIVGAGASITNSILAYKAQANAYKYSPSSWGVPNLSFNPQTGSLQTSGNNTTFLLFGLVAVVVLVLFLRK